MLQICLITNRMIRLIINILTLSIIFIIGFQNAYSEETTISLKQAIGIALEKNDELKASESSLKAKNDEIGISRSSLLPSLNVDENFVRTNNPTAVFSEKLNQGRFSQSDFEISALNDPEPINNFKTSFSVEMPVLAVQDYLSLKSSKSEYLSGKNEFERDRELLVFNIIQSYINVQTAKQFVLVAEKALESAKEHYRISKKRYNSGLGLYSDTLRASSEVSRAKQQMVSTIKTLNVEKRRLGLLLGSGQSVDTDPTEIKIPLQDEQYYLDNSSHRSDIQALKIKHEDAKTNVLIAKSGYLPRFGLRGDYQLDDSNTPFGSDGESWFIGGYMRWELFNGGKREYEIAKAKNAEEESFRLLESLKNSVALKVYDAYLTVDEARKKTEYSKSALKSAEEGARLVEKRYENSLSPLVDLLDAQLNLDRARAELVANKNEFLSSVARLSFVSGTILEDLDIETKQE